MPDRLMVTLDSSLPKVQEVDAATFGAALVSVRDTCADNS